MPGVQSASIESFLKSRNEQYTILENGKVKCVVTGHEMPPVIDVLEKHWNGKRYKRALASAKKSNEVVDWKTYEPTITTSRTDPTNVYCLVTKVELKRDVDLVNKHIAGRRYQSKLKTWKPDEETSNSEAEVLSDADSIDIDAVEEPLPKRPKLE